MYELERYTSTNDLGTAILLQELIEHPVERIVVASSMSIYGEGLYEDAEGRLVETARRKNGDRSWDPLDEQGRPLRPVPTPESKRPSLSSIYALNKFAQEQMTMIAAPAYGIEAVALRLFNVFGPGQALSNPYTGVLAIFASRILNGQAPLIFEDGEQRRDFVHVDDAAEAFARALETPAAAGQILNIGSGADRSIAQVAESLLVAMGRPGDSATITHRGRTGDIRHCFANIERASEVLGFRPACSLEDGLSELAEWVAS
jgi:dTDP-L-rhamnose 4-epimerase